MPTLYSTLHEAIDLHGELIRRFGGSGGVRDLGALESALYRPQSGYYETLVDQAAALLQSLAGNQPFVDGNKRVALALTAIFLRMNGYRLLMSARDGEMFLIDEVITQRVDFQLIAQWLTPRLRAVRK